MKPLETQLELGKRIRALGIDDAPFDRERGGSVNVCGVICAKTRFEGMLWGEMTKDGWDATEKLTSLVGESKFFDQLHVILIDGLTLGGFNIVDLPRLHKALELPCIAVMRRMPDWQAIDQALGYFDDGAERKAILQKAGTVHDAENQCFQLAGCEVATAKKVLGQLTDTGFVPEPLRLAHLIGSAVKKGESGRRA